MMSLAKNLSVTSAVEDYAKTIFKLQNDEPGLQAVTTTALAARLKVSPSSASGMIRRLSELGLVTYAPYHGVRLTETGRRVALDVLRRHRLLESFLVEVLGLGWDQVHDEAEVLEHALSERLEELIAARLGDPVRDPHGDPIPTRDGRILAPPARRLDTLAPGDSGVLVRVSDADPAILRYLTAQGIRLGQPVEVLEREPFGGPLVVRIGASAHSFGGTLAAALWIGAESEAAP